MIILTLLFLLSLKLVVDPATAPVKTEFTAVPQRASRPGVAHVG
jgi:hypothetical protein